MVDNRFPQDVQVKKGHTPSEQIGIAMAALVENGQKELIDCSELVSKTACSSGGPGPSKETAVFYDFRAWRRSSARSSSERSG